MGGAGGAGGRINAGAAGAGGTEAPSWAAPRTAPGPGLSRALTPSHSPRHSRSAARWPSPTCSHPSSLPHSFSRSGCISMPTVTIFSLLCLKSLVRVLPSPFPPEPPTPFTPFSFFHFFPRLSGLPFGWLQNHQLESLYFASMLTPKP